MAPKRVTSVGSVGVYFRGSAPGQHSSKETSQRCRAVDGSASDLTVYLTDNDVFLPLRQQAGGISTYCHAVIVTKTMLNDLRILSA